MSKPQRIIIKSTPDDVTRALLGHMREVILAAVERRGRATLGFSWDEHTTQVLLAMVRFGGLPWEQLDTYLIHENPEGTLHREVFDVALAHVDMDPKHFHTLPAAHLPACFDLLLLGIGPGGQVAGLMPGVGVPEGPPVVATPAGFTLTPSAIQAAEQLVVVGLGPECSGDVARALHGPLQPAALPVQHALEGVWYLDADAAEHLEDTHEEEATRQESATHEEKATDSTRETKDGDGDSDTFSGPRTLAIDIGGTGIKMLVMDPDGKPITERTRVKTPQPATPEAVLAVIGAQAADHRPFERVAVGFPGVVVDGVTLNAPNLDPSWEGEALAEHIEQVLDGAPTRVANDADVQGMGVIEGKGVELVVTLGTGFGSALFVGGTLVPNLELGHHAFEEGRTYEELLGQVALKEVGEEVWNMRLRRAIVQIVRVFNPRLLYFGGGNARLVKGELPEHVRLAQNIAGLLGGIGLWRERR